jgi:predicted double-glycine peptidase
MNVDKFKEQLERLTGKQVLLEEKKIKVDFILDFPELRQIYNYDCGASALQSCLTYYGYDIREDKVVKELGTVSTNIKNNGTNISAIKKIAEKYKLKVSIEYNLGIDKLKEIIKQKIPVILLLQAWHEKTPSKYDYTNSYKDGHYVVAIGWTKNEIIFEDPSSYTRTYLTFDELIRRWHAEDDNGKPDPRSVSIIIKGTPKFKSQELTKMG